MVRVIKELLCPWKIFEKASCTSSKQKSLNKLSGIKPWVVAKRRLKKQAVCETRLRGYSLDMSKVSNKRALNLAWVTTKVFECKEMPCQTAAS